MHMRILSKKWLLILALSIFLQPMWAQAQSTLKADEDAQPMACIDCGDPDEDDAAFVDQSAPASLQTGQTATVTIRMQNTGNTTWRPTSGYNLVPFSPQIGTTWGVSQIASGTIYANQTATFSFSITAPSTAGTYNFQWQMSHAGTWFGVPTVNVAIQVITPGNPPPEVPPSANFSRTETIIYWDNTAKWVLNQTASVTCTASVPSSTACDNNPANGSDVASSTTFDSAYALPLTQSSFGKLQQTLTYDTVSMVSSGQLGTLKTIKDGNNNVTTVADWNRGIPQSIAHADGATASAVVNDSGWIRSATDENGYTTNYTYDAMGRLASIVYPTGDTTAWNTTTQVFEPVASAEVGIAAGHWRQTISTGNARKITYFDALWQPLVTREYDTANEAGTKRYQRFTYDGEGRTTFASYPGTADSLTTGTWTEYDALGRMTSVSQDSELGTLTTLSQYLSGFRTLVTDPRGTQTATAYMAYDQPVTDWAVAIAHPEGAYTEITRDPFGKPTAITRRDSGSTLGVTRSYTYNANQELCRTVEPETGAALMGYDAAGNLKWSAAGLPNGQACEANGTSSAVAARRAGRTYDAHNRVKSLTFPDGVGNQNWTYAPDGLPTQLLTYNTTGGTTVANNYAYNKRRLLISETLITPTVNWPFSYIYNTNGHLSADNWHGLNIDYAPNALGQPTKAGVFANGVSYYPNGAIKQFTYGNGIVHTMT